MENQLFYTVYRTTNTLNGHYYIGVHKTKNPNDSYIGSGIALKAAIKKYGRSVFIKEVLFVFATSQEAYSKERELVTESVVADANAYNLTLGGIPTLDCSEERKQIQKIRMTGENHPQFGKPQTPESNAKRSATLRAKPNKRSPESYRIQADKRRGIPSKCKGIPQSKESNQKRSEAHLALEKVQCPHCGTKSDPGNAKRWHFDNCSKLTLRIVPQALCPHCGVVGNAVTMKRWHFDRCRQRVD